MILQLQHTNSSIYINYNGCSKQLYIQNSYIFCINTSNNNNELIFINDNISNVISKIKELILFDIFLIFVFTPNNLNINNFNVSYPLNFNLIKFTSNKKFYLSIYNKSTKSILHEELLEYIILKF